MSKLVSFEIEDFMGFEHGIVTFDDTGIISLKGYNSNGKTTIIRAIGVLNFGMWTTKQSKFIRYGMNRFRLSETFDDGVKIVYEKYAVGKSSYQMFKDGEEIFSTIQNGVYTSFKGVPDFIRKYLNFADDAKLNLHIRRGRDQLLLVDTTGRDNYDFLSVTLKAEEVGNASGMLKTDRLQLKSDIQYIEYQLETHRSLVTRDTLAVPVLVNHLEQVDKDLDLNESKKAKLDKLFQLVEKYNRLKPSLPLEQIGVLKVKKLQSVMALIEKYNNIQVTAKLDKLEADKLVRLRSILNKIERYNETKQMPTLQSIDFTKHNKLVSIMKQYNNLVKVDSQLEKRQTTINEMEQQVIQIENWLNKNKVQVIRCKNCNSLQAVGEVHAH